MIFHISHQELQDLEDHNINLQQNKDIHRNHVMYGRQESVCILIFMKIYHFMENLNCKLILKLKIIH